MQDKIFRTKQLNPVNLDCKLKLTFACYYKSLIPIPETAH